MTPAERTAQTHCALYSSEPFAGPIPRCVLEPIRDREPEHVGLVQFIAGWVAVLAICGLIFWGL